MTLDELIHNLTKMRSVVPGTTEVLTAADSEGNSFHPVYYAPTLGNWDKREFTSEVDLEEEERNEKPDSWYNAVVVN